MGENPIGLTDLQQAVARLTASTDWATIRQQAPTAIARAAALVLDSASQHHGEFLAAGERAGLSAPMVREALANYLPLLAEQGLRELQAAELQVTPGQTLVSPSLIFHVLAGNLFISGIESINQALLVGSPSLVRCSEEDQFFARAWKAALHAADAHVGAAVEVGWWPRDQLDLTQCACKSADVVVAFGSDESVATLRSLTPVNVRFVPHGSKVSFALISAEALTKEPQELGARLAYDFSVYDQQGCLSPRAVFVEQVVGGAREAFRTSLAETMQSLLGRLPRQTLSLEARASLARERQDAIMSPVASGDTRLVSRPADEFVIVARPVGEFRLGCVDRFVDIRTFRNFEEVRTALVPYRRKIACIGVPEDDKALAHLALGLQPSRICALGSMQKPPLGWTHDGRMPLRDLVEFTSLEL